MNASCWFALLAVLALAPRAGGQTSLWTIDGSAQNQSFGWSVCTIGDVDGDSVGDLAVGAPGDATSGIWAGALFVRSGATGAPIAAAYGPSSGAYLGRDLAPAGDVDGDGVPDVVSPALDNDSPVGRVRVYSAATGALVRTFTGSTFGYGEAVDGIGDVDGDLHADLLVGVPDYTNGGLNAGAVFLVSGQSGVTIRIMSETSPGVRLGSSVASVDDLDGDGVRDVVAGGTHAGIGVKVFSGAIGILLYTFATGSFATHLVAGGGDFDGDNRGDFVVGVASSTTAGGLVRVYSGATGTLIRQHAALCGAVNNGSAVVVLGDVDGDGRADYAARDFFAYRWRIWSGATGHVVWDLPRSDLTDLARMGDHDGDGRDDVLVGLGNGSAGFSSSGQVQLAIDGLPAVAGTPVALGDGSGAPCPCGNTGTPGAGCANSSGLGGRLEALGPTSLLDRSLWLRSTGIPVGRVGLLFSGTIALNGGLGMPLADGLRGAGGSMDRLFTRTTCEPAFTWGPNLPPYAQWTAGQTYVLQLWYRDLSGPCGSGSNLTNAVAVTMTP